MPLDPSIPLAAVGPNVQQQNPLQNAALLAQLQQFATQQQLARLQVAEAEQTAQERKAAREVFAGIQQQGIDINTPEGQQALRSQLLPVAPNSAAGLLKALNEGRKVDAETMKAAEEARKMQLQTAVERLNAMDAILGNTTPETFPQDRLRLIELGYKPEAIPVAYDPKALEAARNRLTPIKDQAELQFKQREQQERQSLEERKLQLQASENIMQGGEAGIAIAKKYGEAQAFRAPNMYSAAELAPRTTVETEEMKRLQANAVAAQDVHHTLDEAEKLIKEGVYTASPLNNTAIAAYSDPNLRLVTPGYDPEKLARTVALRNLGSQLALDKQGGKVASQTSNYEQEMIKEASGNLQAIPTEAQLKLSIQHLRELANRRIQERNDAFKAYPVPSNLPEAKAPQVSQVITRADYEQGKSRALKNGATVEQYETWIKSHGYKVQ